ncbi:MAG: hypothetical protein K9L32_15580, partial [Chromatiaceae bacterium]|nr:hypothetical protein [Chromatiaceae bacterium]
MMADDQEQNPVENAEKNPVEGQEQAKPRMGFLPKMVLWSLVLLFGFLYLGSLERKTGESLMPFSMGGGDRETPAAAVPAAASGAASEIASAAPSAPPAQPEQTAPASGPKSPAAASAPA